MPATNNIFEQIKKINEYNQEFWSARDIYKLLGYTEYGKFIPAIERAKEACKNSKQNIDDHFAGMSEMITIATGTPKETEIMRIFKILDTSVCMEGCVKKTSMLKRNSRKTKQY